MFRDLLVLLGIVAAIAALSLAFLSQRYWFARGWRFAGRLQRSKWRTGMRAALLSVLVIVILIAFTDLLRNWRGAVSLGSWWTPFFGLWLSSSMFSYLFIKLIAGADWLWRRLRSGCSAVSHTPAVSSVSSEGINHS